MADILDGAVVASDIRFEILRTVPRKRHYHSPAGCAIAGAAGSRTGAWTRTKQMRAADRSGLDYLRETLKDWHGSAMAETHEHAADRRG